MSRGFYRLVFCACKAHENEGTLNAMVRAFTWYIGDLGTSRQATIPKAWLLTKTSCTCVGLFYPNLAKVGKEFAERREGVYWGYPLGRLLRHG
jgi:hypothetical protein